MEPSDLRIKTNLTGKYDYWGDKSFILSDERPTELDGEAVNHAYLNKKLNKYLYRKYASSQNYYFTRDVNDYLSETRTGPAFVIKDYYGFYQVKPKKAEFFENGYFHYFANFADF